jgi:hypothetical protein
MATEVTDPALLAQLNGVVTPQPVSDPALLAQLNAPAPVDPGTGTLGHQLVRGIGLSANALAHGVVGAVNMVPDAMTAAYNFVQNPHIPKWSEINPFSAEAWPSNTPSAYANRALDSALPTPQTTAEKVASFGLGMEGGALVPAFPVPDSFMPGGMKAPEEFVSPKQLQAQRLAASLKEAQDKGYVVPPSTTNPTLFNKTLETIGGKEATQNQARVINQTARNAGAAEDLGLTAETLTPDAVNAVKQEAGKAFEAARSIPRFAADAEYGKDLDSVLSANRGANADFPGASNPDVEKIVDTYRQPSFTGDAAVSATKLLRQKANDAYRNGQSELGAAYKGVSAAIERQTERGAASLEKPPDPQQYSLNMDYANQGDVGARRIVDQVVPPTQSKLALEFDPNKGRFVDSGVRSTRKSVVQQSGPPQQLGAFGERAAESFGEQPTSASPGTYTGLIDALKKGRQLYAKASTAEEAMDPNGNVSGQKLAAALRRKEPLDGNLLLAAEHATNYPKANLQANSSNISHLNLYAAPLMAREGYHVAGVPGAIVGAALPFARGGSRAYLLSGMGQAGARPQMASQLAQALQARFPTSVAGAVNASN